MNSESDARWKIASMTFARVYPLYLQKAERKGRTRDEVDAVICWLTGYDRRALAEQTTSGNDFETFFAHAPQIHPHAAKITGVICGVRVEEIKDDLVRNVRRLDKLVDELAKGRPLEKVLRQG